MKRIGHLCLVQTHYEQPAWMEFELYLYTGIFRIATVVSLKIENE